MKRSLEFKTVSIVAASICAVVLLIAGGPDAMAQTPGELWGVTYGGGQDDLGVIFKTDASGSLIIPRYEFNFTTPGRSPHHTHLLQATNGKLYGVTEFGGTSDKGVLFEYDPVTGVYVKKINFNGTNGGNPFGSLIQGTNGKLYGMTNTGGANNLGVLFEYNLTTSTYTKRIDFSGSANGSGPRGSLLQATNGKIYGMTGFGGLSNTGVIFEFDPVTNILTKKYDFASINGSYGYGTPVQAANGKLYGMSLSGGTSSKGVIFEYDPVTAVYTKKIDFIGSNGDTPNGSFFKAANGKLYGLTITGGTSGGGVLFEYDPVTNTLTKKVDIGNTSVSTGANPFGTLTQAANGKLYGLSYNGGLNTRGSLFEYDIVGNTFTRKFSFDITNGEQPQGSLMTASDGKLYGMTTLGGRNGGVLFDFDPVTGTYTKRFDFNTAGNGAQPTGELVQASNGKLYGTTISGNDSGVLYEIDPATSFFTKKIDFTGPNGSYPRAGLVRANGKLYGTTTGGGTLTYGVLFEYDPVSSAYAIKYEFDYSSSGFSTYGTLTLAPNGKLYGMNVSGGANSGGTIYEYDPTSNVFTKQFDFASISGSAPYGALTLAPNGKFYALTSSGGASGFGTLFEYDYSNGIVTTKFDFDGTAHGANPYGGLTVGPNGKLYAAVTGGGVNSEGVIIEYDPSSNIVTKKHDFANSTTGSFVQGTLVLSTNNKLYGLAQSGGSNGFGTFFEFDPTTGIFTKKQDLTPGTGTYPAYTGLMVLKNNQTITFGTLTDKVMGDTPISLTGTASSALPLVYSTTSGNISVAGNQVTLLNPGRVSITATQPGNISFLEATSNVTQSFCVRPAKSTISVTNANTTTHTLTSSTASGNAWFLNGVAIPGATGTSIQITQPGTYAVRSQVDDCVSDFSSDLIVANQTITFNTIPDKTLGSAPFTVAATVTSGLPITYTASSNKVAIAGNQVTLVSAGRVTLFAAQPGAVGYFPAAPVQQSFCITPSKPVITVTNTNSTSPLLTSNAAAGNQWYLNGNAIANATNTSLQISQPGIYKVRSQADDCISSFSDDQVFVVTGDLQPTVGTVQIYPNPVSDWLTVSMGERTGSKRVTIYQAMGKRMDSAEVTADEAMFYVADYTPGIYIVKIATENSMEAIRFVKQ